MILLIRKAVQTSGNREDGQKIKLGDMTNVFSNDPIVELLIGYHDHMFIQKQSDRYFSDIDFKVYHKNGEYAIWGYAKTRQDPDTMINSISQHIQENVT